MLIISRKPGESFFVGEDIEIVILDSQNDKVKVGISAPKNISIIRRELKEIGEANCDSANSLGMTDYAVLKNFIKSDV